MEINPFNQSPPEIGNQFLEDKMLSRYLKRVLPEEMFTEILPELESLGEIVGHKLYKLQLKDRLNEPILTQWDPWGNRIDQIEVTEVWHEAEKLATKYGLIATAYEQKHGRYSRVHQFALAYLFTPATDIYSCPLAMTDGAAKTLLCSENQALIERALPHLVSREKEQFWTSGQWMTESTGGSDVGQTETIAIEDNGQWKLFGRKWFTSAVTAQMSLTLGRPEGNLKGGKGLALFYVELRDEKGQLNGIEVNRLKDKLGTKKVPTAELILNGTNAELVMGRENGIRNITPMLNITRTWNAISAISLMRRGIALAKNYAQKRVAFGSPLSEKPLHQDTLAMIEAEFQASFVLTFYLVSLIGAEESKEMTEEQSKILRFLTSITKLVTGKQAVSVLSEVLESFGGAGYVEDTGLPVLLRDAQVLPIWEGTTNVLSLDTLKVMLKDNSLSLFSQTMNQILENVNDLELKQASMVAREAMASAMKWFEQSKALGIEVLETGARRFSLTIGRAFSLALLIEHADWLITHHSDETSKHFALRFACHQIDHIASFTKLNTNVIKM